MNHHGRECSANGKSAHPSSSESAGAPDVKQEMKPVNNIVHKKNGSSGANNITARPQKCQSRGGKH